MRSRSLLLGLVVGFATVSGGCAGAQHARLASGSASDSLEGQRPPGETPAAPMPPPAAAVTECVGPASCSATRKCWSGCGLPCEQGLGDWHAGLVGGRSFWEGTDAGNQCSYFGADVGRALCGSCWSVGGFWRTHTTRFDRDPAGEDGGTWNHVGLKVTYERSLGGGRWFVWGGVGPEYFWTTDYIQNDSGFGVFGEAGLGYLLNCHWKIRAGVNVHGMSTETGRRSAADDGDSRWLWIVSPVVGIEFDF